MKNLWENLDLSYAVAEPIYDQIARQVTELVRSGELRAGDTLPPIRILAEKLELNQNTVGRAIRQLEKAGIVITRRSAGTIVADLQDATLHGQRLKVVDGWIAALIKDAEGLGISIGEIISLIGRRIDTR